MKVLAKFIEVYCKSNHQNMKKGIWKDNLSCITIELCNECIEIMNYSANRLSLCPLDPKPSCKNCTVHCYAPEQRKKIKEIMRFSGIKLIKKGRLDYLFHYFF
jgi:hypothetical protein